MSVVSYNGVTIPYCHITDFRQEVIYDDSGTDRLYTKFDIVVMGVINAAYADLLTPGLAVPAARNPADYMAYVGAKLRESKKTLSVKFNGVELIPIVREAPVGGVQPQLSSRTTDAKNGPLPQSCIISNLTNTTFLLSWRVIAHYWENIELQEHVSPMTENRRSNSVLSNRWTESVDIDALNYTRRTRRGKYIIASNNIDTKIADQFRETMAVTSIPEGCIRESANYTLQPDGLALEYTIIDREVFKLPPSPAFKAIGQYTETAPKKNSYRNLRVRLQLEGSKEVDQMDLLKKAIEICTSKLFHRVQIIAPTNVGPGGQMEDTKFMIDMYENKVEVEMGMVVNASRARVGGLSLILGQNEHNTTTMTTTPLSDPQGTAPTPLHKDRGSMGYLLQAAAYYDPSLVGLQLEQLTNQLVEGDQIGQG